MREAQSAIHKTLQFPIEFNNVLHISLYPPPSASTHMYTSTPTQSRNPSLLPLSLPVSLHFPSPQNHQSASGDVCSKIDIQSSTASNAPERVTAAQSRLK